ncbi:FXYD domain-containing ion transport regulator 3 isoform X2 [Pteropus medius]|uniref:FXYD domain-containing ion transport regulator 3 isoform X2 n=1 Tax=Pteropus vampyrus TaxID=132908 RepID=UPI00196AD78F|nr:FXYD domain-containing ion transport regulator 3 isoform X2 [Pteropus giganteus]
MQQVTLSLLVLLAGLPALAANDPEDKNSPFYYDWHSLRVGGLICAGILCAIGIIVLMSGKCKCKFNQKPRTGEPDEEEGTFRSSIRRLSSRRR